MFVGFIANSVLLLLSVFLTNTYINMWPESSDVNSLLAFVVLSPFFAFILRNPSGKSTGLIITTTIYFMFIGLATSQHFKISVYYGFAIGFMQGAFMSVALCGFREDVASNDWKLFGLVLISMVTMDYVVAIFYGIAFLLPIQLYRFPFLIQPIALFGFFFLDAFVIAVNLFVGKLLASLIGVEAIPQKSYGLLMRFGLGMILAWSLLCLVCDRGEDVSSLPSVRVSTISPGKKFEGDLSDILNLTLEASVNDRSQFVVWPELYINPRYQEERTCEKYIRDEVLPRVKSIDSYLVVGCDERTKDSDCPFGNLAFTIAPNGTSILGFYGKQHPVTMIGERSCIRDGYKSYKVSDSAKINGHVVPQGLTISTLICYDMDFGDSVSRVAGDGAHLVLNPSEDWAAARGHFAASVFRAIENRVSVAKCDWGWDSVIIDPFGKVQASFTSKDDHRQVLTANVPILLPRSHWYYFRQNVFPWLCISVLVISLVRKAAKRFRLRSISPPVDIEARLVSLPG